MRGNSTCEPPQPEEDLTHCCPLGYGCGTSSFLPSYHYGETLQAAPWNNSWTARCCCERKSIWYFSHRVTVHFNGIVFVFRMNYPFKVLNRLKITSIIKWQNRTILSKLTNQLDKTMGSQAFHCFLVPSSLCNPPTVPLTTLIKDDWPWGPEFRGAERQKPHPVLP